MTVDLDVVVVLTLVAAVLLVATNVRCYQLGSLYGRRVAGAAMLVRIDERVRLRRLLARCTDALLWCSGSTDFNEGGRVRVGWERTVAPLLRELTAEFTGAALHRAVAEPRVVDARSALFDLRDVMWPPADPGREWTADTHEAVARILKDAGYGPAPQVSR